MLQRISFGFMLAVLAVTFVVKNSHAGTFEITVIEDKGTFQEFIPVTRIVPDRLIFVCTTCGAVLGGATVPSLETVLIPAGPPFRLFNIYPDLIDVPQPFDPNRNIDFAWVMAADTGTGIGPVPSGLNLQNASLVGVSGTQFPATIQSISNLAALPTSSPNDLRINWDLSPFSQTTGSFFLVQATIPGSQIVPEPSTGLLLGSGLLGILGYSWQRRIPRPQT